VEFMRGVVLVLNILFAIFGLILIGFGLYAKLDSNFTAVLSNLTNATEIQGQAVQSLALVMIAAGVITLLISLFGCVGALWHNRCYLYMYALILGILLILELVGFIMAFVYKGKLEEIYDSNLRKILIDAANKTDATSNKTLAAFVVLQKQFKCCGAANYSDYGRTVPNLPDSCFNDDQHKFLRENGCSKAIIDFLGSKLPILGGILGGFLFVELLGLIGAIVLAVALKHAPDDNYSSNPGDVLRGLNPRRNR